MDGFAGDVHGGVLLSGGLVRLRDWMAQVTQQKIPAHITGCLAALQKTLISVIARRGVQNYAGTDSRTQKTRTMTVPAPVAEHLLLPAPVLLVEDDPLMQKRMHALLLQLGYPPGALTAVGLLGEARAYLADQPVALALVDLRLPDGSGIDLIAEMHAANPDLGIVVVSAWSTREEILASLRAGAVGYVLKERDDMEVILALRSVLRGGAPIDPFVARQIIEVLPTAVTGQQDNPGLSQRESEILRLVAEGLGNRDIAQRLFLSRYTVEAHIKHIYRKLAVSSRTQAMQAARQRGLLG
jgi:DNA-binding NarL/FixJ family response regulator